MKSTLRSSATVHWDFAKRESDANGLRHGPWQDRSPSGRRRGLQIAEKLFRLPAAPVNMATPAVVAETYKRPAAWPRVLMLLGRLALGAIFVFAAFTKLYFNGGWHFGDYQFFFSMVISSYNILPAWAVQPAAQILPWFELLLGLLLLAGIGIALDGADGMRDAAHIYWRNDARVHERPGDHVRLFREQRKTWASYFAPRQQHAHPRDWRDNWRVSNQETQGHGFFLIPAIPRVFALE